MASRQVETSLKQSSLRGVRSSNLKLAYWLAELVARAEPRSSLPELHEKKTVERQIELKCRFPNGLTKTEPRWLLWVEILAENESVSGSKFLYTPSARPIAPTYGMWPRTLQVETSCEQGPRTSAH